MSLKEQIEQLRRGDIGSEGLTEAYLERIAGREPEIHAFLAVDREGAIAAARESDERRRKGKLLSPIDGIPYAIKDNFCTEGLVTTAGSRILEGYRPQYDATVVKKLKEAGAVLLGKTNLDAFGMGCDGGNSDFGRTKNPRDPSRVPGGSSSGSAAAVAAGMCAFAIGSDTGGSVRQPAAFCGICGFKPGWGRISRYGLIAYASSLDTVGILANDPSDMALLYRFLCGRDGLDQTVVPSRFDNEERSAESEKMTVWIPARLGDYGISGEVQSAFEAAKNRFSEAGARLEALEMPSADEVLASYYILACAEASSNLARFDGIRFGIRGEGKSPDEFYENTRSSGFGDEVKRRILFGTWLLSAGNRESLYGRARSVREKVRRTLASALAASGSFLILPTAPTVAYPLHREAVPGTQYRGDLLTVLASLAGLPAISVPCGSGEKNLPAGLQILAGEGRECELLALAGRLFSCG